MVVYITIFGLILFPFGVSADSINSQGIEVDWPLEEIYVLSLVLIFLSFFLLFFYRDPHREIQEGIVSPADGIVQKAIKKNGMIKISIFMGLQNVHVNRSPIDGRVISQKHKPGGYTPAFSKDSDKTSVNSAPVEITTIGFPIFLYSEIISTISVVIKGV